MAKEKRKLPESQRQFLDFALQDAAKQLKCSPDDLLGEFKRTKEGRIMLSVKMKDGVLRPLLETECCDDCCFSKLHASNLGPYSDLFCYRPSLGRNATEKERSTAKKRCEEGLEQK